MIDHEWVVYISMFTLVWGGLYYGYRFVRLNNHLLGYEWIVLGLSATCGILYVSDTVPEVMAFWPFLDIFSKLFGVTIIGALGLMRVTHGLELSQYKEVVIFLIGVVASYVFMVSSSLAVTINWVSFLTGLLFLMVVVLLALQAFRSSLPLHGWVMVAVIVSNISLSLWRDFLGGGGSTMNLESLAFIVQHWIWSASVAAIFYSYQALGQRKGLL